MTIYAGSAVVEITPLNSLFIAGYPHVERYSTGIHDPLQSASLYLFDGQTHTMFIANDIFLVSKSLAAQTRKRIEQVTSVPAENIMITATHTHSCPNTIDYLCCEDDIVTPKVDRNYVQFIEDKIVEGAIKAYESAQPAKVGLAIADGTGVGTNRLDPKGPYDPQVPVLMVKSADDNCNIAAMMVYSMHPTVLHEDSTLFSGDFPAMARQYLQKNVLGENCPILYHTGPEGNQSLRHVTRANTFEEATRFGNMLGQSVEKVINQIDYATDIKLCCSQRFVELPRRTFPTVEQAKSILDIRVKKLQELRDNNAPHHEIRTAECEWFGAEETVTLAKAVDDGRMEAAYKSCMPAEIQLIKVGKWAFVGWPGEMFIEFSLGAKKANNNIFVIALANGELQGYIVTPQAAAEGGYEASCAMFAPESGDIFIKETLDMLL